MSLHCKVSDCLNQFCKYSNKILSVLAKLTMLSVFYQLTFTKRPWPFNSLFYLSIKYLYIRCLEVDSWLLSLIWFWLISLVLVVLDNWFSCFTVGWLLVITCCLLVLYSTEGNQMVRIVSPSLSGHLQLLISNK